MAERRLLRLWGKLGPDGSFHPALYHMLDVGHVARVLLGADGPPRFRAVLARAWDVDDPNSLVDWMPLVVALHDIGKLSAPFQGQDSKPETRAARERLVYEGFRFGQTHGRRYPHQQISAVFAQLAWPRLEPALPQPLALTVRDALGGHHGRFASYPDLTTVREYLMYDEPEEWSAYRAEAYTSLRPCLAPAWQDGVPIPSPPHGSVSAMVLAGFTILCDWLGSDEARFPTASDMPLDHYVDVSLGRAIEAVQGVEFVPVRPQAEYVSFQDLFPAIDQPRPLQQAVDALQASAISWPSLTVIEAPTGEGKTEAALALAQRLASIGPSDELYVALPTTATSNQMFGRVYQFVNHARGLGTPVKLVHGQAFLVEDDLLLDLAPDGDDMSARAAADWFAPKKRSLLAPFGVGTIDQVELTALNARHYMLRLFGLAGKVVIIDEIHAYDTYMSTILEHTLSWLAALGSSVILLSATLPTRRHTALAAAFLQGGEGVAGHTLPTSLPYPSVAVYTPAESHVLHPAAAQPERRLRIDVVEDDTPDEIARRLLDFVREGGAVCHISNTVAGAQAIFQQLEHQDLGGVKSFLLHSRFPVEQRQELEGTITATFGPASNRRPEDRAIVVGTQVLEQSLDLDFDAMVSDLAPIDLLLQRAGRLQRHNREPTSARGERTLHVRLPREQGVPALRAWTAIYDEFVLWMTLRTLEERRAGHSSVTLRLPEDYRPLIEAVYGAEFPSLPDEWPFSDLARAAFRAYRTKQATAVGEARLRLVPEPSLATSVMDAAGLEFMEEQEGGDQGWSVAKTRLGYDNLTVIPLYRLGDDLALDPAGTNVLGPKCDRATQLRLLRRSIPLAVTPARQELAGELRAARDTAPGWFRDATLLRWTVPLILEDDKAHFGSTVLTLDPRLGLLIGKEGTW